MKTTFISILLISLAAFSCNKPAVTCEPPTSLIQKIDSLQTRIDALETLVKPRLSVLMNRLQVHHSRMWEPGINGNWALLSYEFGKTRESLEDIKLLYGESSHGSSQINTEINKLDATIDSLSKAVEVKSKDDFVKSYNTLTLKCNSCHKEVGLDFYEIIKPSKPAYSGEMQ